MSKSTGAPHTEAAKPPLLLQLEFRTAVAGDGVRYAYVQEQIAEHVVREEPVVELVHNNSKVLALQGEVVGTDVLERGCTCRGDGLIWGYVGLVYE